MVEPEQAIESDTRLIGRTSSPKRRCPEIAAVMDSAACVEAMAGYPAIRDQPVLEAL